MPKSLEFVIDLLVNLLASVIFWLGLGLAVRATAVRKTHREFRRFFGLRKLELTVYLSNLWDSASMPDAPGTVVAGQEFRILQTVTNLFGSASARLPDMVRGLVDTFWLKDKIAFDVKVSPYRDLDDGDTEAGPFSERDDVDLSTSMIVVGTSLKNSVRRYYVAGDLPLLRIGGEPQELIQGYRAKSPLEPRVIKTRGSKLARKVEPPPDIDAASYPAIVEKFRDKKHNSDVFMCIGYNGYCSWAAVEYLCQHWSDLAEQYGQDPFALCLWFPAIESKGKTEYEEPYVQEVVP